MKTGDTIELIEDTSFYKKGRKAHFIKKSDKNKPVFATRAKILEKITDTLFVGWYLVEFENGERLKLRTFEPRKVFFSAGDIGILRYQGITILSFQKENRPPMR